MADHHHGGDNIDQGAEGALSAAKRPWRTPRVITSTVNRSTTEVSTLRAIADGGFSSVYS